MYRYRQEDVTASVTCDMVLDRFAPESKKQGGRWQATWRGGDGYNVAVYDNGRKWADHGGSAEVKGGDVVTLYMVISGLDFTSACDELGAMYCPEKEVRKQAKSVSLSAMGKSYKQMPKPMTQEAQEAQEAQEEAPAPPQEEEQEEEKIYPPIPDDTPKPVTEIGGMAVRRAAKSQLSQHQQMEADGWVLIQTYYYRKNRKVQFEVERWERESEKTFRQRNAAGEYNMRDVELIPYNLDDVEKASTVYIVEGEKCADELSGCYVATTSPAGAGNWKPSFNKYFSGKDVIILCDNDEAGRKHGDKVAAELIHVAARVKVVYSLGDKPKYDVADYLAEKSKGNNFDTLDRIVNAVEWMRVPRIGEISQSQIEDAKRANLEPFRNYVEREIETDSGKTKKVKQARLQQDLIDDLRVRALGYPFVISGVLFDYAKQEDGSRKVVFINNSDDITAWIGFVCKTGVDFQYFPMAVKMSVFQSALIQQSHEFETFSRHPHYPFDDRVFYDIPEMPKPTADRRFANEFFSFFNPATDDDLVLIKTMYFSLLWHPKMHFSRPGFFVGSDDGKGSGKTTLVKILKDLMRCKAYDVQPNQLKDSGGIEELKKGLVSAEGKEIDIMLFDNISGELASPTLANLMTADSITARAPYGKGTITRINDLTYCFTSNDGTVNSDLAQRLYPISIRKNYVDNWESSIKRYIEDNRWQVLADMIAVMADSRCRDWQMSVTRFSEFDRAVLMPACRDEEEYRRVAEALNPKREAINSDIDIGEQVDSAMLSVIAETPDSVGCSRPLSDSDNVFLQNQVALRALKNNGINDVKTVKRIAELASDKKLKRVFNGINSCRVNGSSPPTRGVLVTPEPQVFDKTRPLKIIRLDNRGNFVVSMATWAGK